LFRDQIINTIAGVIIFCFDTITVKYIRATIPEFSDRIIDIISIIEIFHFTAGIINDKTRTVIILCDEIIKMISRVRVISPYRIILIDIPGAGGIIPAFCCGLRWIKDPGLCAYRQAKQAKRKSKVGMFHGVSLICESIHK
jgi:hypothetical protein